MRECKAAGLGTYALSNWSARDVRNRRGPFGWLGELDGILISGGVGLSKPNPAIFHEFLRRFSLDPVATDVVDGVGSETLSAAAAEHRHGRDPVQGRRAAEA